VRHYADEVDGWFAFRAAYDAILAALPADRPSVVVELGTWVGKSTVYLGVEIVNSGKPVTLVAVDHFRGSAEIAGTRRAGAVAGSEAAFRRNIAPVAQALGPRLVVLVSDTAAAAASFDDGSVDAVWVDAAHGYEFVQADLAAWVPKLRPGGVIGGDDYLKCPGVRQAVDERFGPAAHTVGAPYWMVRSGA
jgi:predicted O-methyltransferase YrrM